MYKMASTDDLGDALLAFSSVYVVSAAIGLVLGLFHTAASIRGERSRRVLAANTRREYSFTLKRAQ